MLYIYIFSFTFIITAVIILVINSVNNSRKQENQGNINNKVEPILKKANFNTSKIFFLTDYSTVYKDNYWKKMVCVDANAKKFAFVDYNDGKVTIIDFHDIINYEIYKNGNTSTSGGAVGGWYFGLFGSETEETIKELKLIIRINSFEKPQVVYDIISNTTFNAGLYKSSKQFQVCMKSLQEFTSFLEVVLNENKNNK